MNQTYLNVITLNVNDNNSSFEKQKTNRMDLKTSPNSLLLARNLPH